MKNALLYKTFPTLDSHRQAIEGDVILVSDVDEIPKPETITLLRYANPHNHMECHLSRDICSVLLEEFC